MAALIERRKNKQTEKKIMNSQQLKKFVDRTWDESILSRLEEYIRIPNKSPAFDPDWQQHGYMQQAMALIEEWCAEHAALEMKMEVVELAGRTPLLFIEIPGQSDETVLLYGHMDKQPEMVGWEEGLAPWKPVRRGDKLYGRGGADDGYAVFAALTAINALQQQSIAHGRCVIIIEACEESGSYDLPFYIDALKERIGSPSLIVCLDSGCANYKQLWVTTNLRGMFTADLTVEILREGIHSGYGSGIVPSSFRIARQLLSRIEDEQSGQLLDELYVDIPEQRQQQVRQVAEMLDGKLPRAYPFVEGATPVTDDTYELLLNRAWRPTLSIIGIDGIPALQDAGNVLRPKTTLKLSFRLAPTCHAEHAAQLVKRTLETDPPYGAKVTVNIDNAESGWNAPIEKAWLTDALEEASHTYFEKSARYIGEGGSIPFMGMLGEKFPQAQFFITGVLGPKSNAHGPNEFLHIPMAKKLTCCVAHVLHQHYTNFR